TPVSDTPGFERWTVPATAVTLYGTALRRAEAHGPERTVKTTQPDQIIQLLLLEQFYNYSPPEVRDWVRDWRPLTLSEATRLADEYQDARQVAPPVIRAPPPRFHPGPQLRPAPLERAPRPLAPPTPAPRVGPQCYGCNQIGHIRDHCPLNTHRPAPSRAVHPPSRAVAYCCHQEPEPTAALEEDWGILHEADPVQAATQDNPSFGPDYQGRLGTTVGRARCASE
uniref:CCHC-type domain-containing protein n=1 Tax=Leptobrachium leishanense TaxID=445787 RepID=A0A8C5Q1W3_9ANUR